MWLGRVVEKDDAVGLHCMKPPCGLGPLQLAARAARDAGDGAVGLGKFAERDAAGPGHHHRREQREELAKKSFAMIVKMAENL